jgi:biotin synthase
MYSFGPFLPHPDTPLAGEKPPVPEEVLKTLAVARIADPVKSRLVVATAFETLYQPALRAGLISGANSLMLILTPDKYRKQYQIYPGRPHAGESISQQIKKTLDILRDLGRAPTDLGLDF